MIIIWLLADHDDYDGYYDESHATSKIPPTEMKYKKNISLDWVLHMFHWCCFFLTCPTRKARSFSHSLTRRCSFQWKNDIIFYVCSHCMFDHWPWAWFYCNVCVCWYLGFDYYYDRFYIFFFSPLHCFSQRPTTVINWACPDVLS